MQELDEVVRSATNAERDRDYRQAAHLYTSAALLAAEHKNKDQAADLYMHAAVCLEHAEDWRHIGLLWLRVAHTLRGQSSTSLEARYRDSDAALHHFPAIDRTAWTSMSRAQRVARAFRYAGYHLEKAGTNQSAHRQYRDAAATFADAELWDDASRSYLLAALSFIRQYGELDPALLLELERCFKALIASRRFEYVNRLRLYYRQLRVELALRGNADDASTLFIRECQMRTQLFRMKGRYVDAAVLGLWGLTSRYGTSFNRWLAMSTVLILVVFPFSVHTAGPDSYGHALLQSINAFFGRTDVVESASLLTNSLILIETIVGYVMLGSLAAMIISKIVR